MLLSWLVSKKMTRKNYKCIIRSSISANSTGKMSLGEGLFPSLVPLKRELLSIMFWLIIWGCFKDGLKSGENWGSTNEGSRPLLSVLNTD